ncbi:MAG: Na+/H+ antiporter NhaA [Cyclobacteriaceae bacterium]
MRKKRPVDYLLNPVYRFFENEMATGILLLVMVVIAMIWANSPWSASYHHLWETHFMIGTSEINMDKSLHHWINDGLMAIFFFLIGLEIKKEIINGELSTIKKASLPIAAALGGMVVPAGIYAFFNAGTEGISGWGIPMATDIAFTLGLVAFIRSKVPVSLKIFLTALATVDDIGAVLVIAVFYTPDIQVMQLVYAAIFLGLMYGCNLLGVRSFWVYLLIGVLGLWTSILYSGVHATVAGVIAAFAIPARVRTDKLEYSEKLRQWAKKYQDSYDEDGPFVSRSKMEIISKIEAESEQAQTPLQRFEHQLVPLVSYFVIPLFALANSGVTIEGDIIEMIMHPVSIGIIAGLTIGKTVGVLGFTRLLTISGGSLPTGANWFSVGGIAMLAGIGFTMSLFIAELAFSDPVLIAHAKIGILVASFLAATLGILWFKFYVKKPQAE